jgi:hypothetical protein
MMPKLALLSVWIFCLPAQGGLHILLRPLEDCPYQPGQVIPIEVLGQLTPSETTPSSLPIDFLRFDLSDTDAAVGINLSPTHDSAEHEDISFWYFGNVPACALGSQCGERYQIDDSVDSDNLLSMLYTGPQPNSEQQLMLYQDRLSLIGLLEVVYPTQPGTYVLNFLNADTADANQGAEFRSGDIVWRASEGAIVGGYLSLTPLFCVPEPTSLMLALAACVVLLAGRPHRQIKPDSGDHLPVSHEIFSPDIMVEWQDRDSLMS